MKHKRKCNWCDKKKNMYNMYFVMDVDDKEIWICPKCNIEHEIV